MPIICTLENAEHAVSTRRAGQYKVCQLANGGNTRCGPLPGPCHCLHCTDVTRGSHQLVTRLVSTLSLALLPQLPVTRARTMGSAWRVSVCVSLGSLPTLSTQYTISMYNLSLTEKITGKHYSLQNIKYFTVPKRLLNKMSLKFVNI